VLLSDQVPLASGLTRIETMTKRGFHARLPIVRQAIRADLTGFALPAILVFSAGLLVSLWDGWEGLVETLEDLAKDRHSLSRLPIQTIVGLALIFAGYVIMFVAAGTLGRSYSSTLVIREGQPLITHGIYRLTRHPLYLGVLMVCFGVPICASSWRGCLVMALLIPIFLHRIRLEERLLLDEFGEAYQTYMQGTNKLLPYIY
jgi:protein-S-isoprenylcysteine O-methyltransferase Ste14